MSRLSHEMIVRLQGEHLAPMSDEMRKLIEVDSEVAKRSRDESERVKRLNDYVPGFDFAREIGLPPEVGLQVMHTAINVIERGLKSILVDGNQYKLATERATKHSAINVGGKFVPQVDIQSLEAEIGLVYLNQVNPEATSDLIEKATGEKGQSFLELSSAAKCSVIDFSLGRIEQYQEPKKKKFIGIGIFKK